MRRVTGTLPAYVPWAVAVVLLLALAGMLACAFWPDETEPPVTVLTSGEAGVPLKPPTAPAPATTRAPAVTPATSTSLVTTATSTTSTTVPPPAPALAFDVDLAMSHIRLLAENIGVRVSGSESEALAAGYVAEYLESLGYSVLISQVPLPDGSVSQNLRALKTGSSASVVMVGAHVDSKAPSPGANDNASGVAVVLELARDLRDADITPSVEFVLFGAEEMVDSNADHHHYGSRRFVQEMTAEERSALVAMISVDMVAYGDEFLVRDMGRGPPTLTEMLLAYSGDHGLGVLYAEDTGTYGWSDHEPFELAGFPAAWLEWHRDPAYHTKGDTYGHCDPEPVRRTGELLLGFLRYLTESDLALLAQSRDLD